MSSFTTTRLCTVHTLGLCVTIDAVHYPIPPCLLKGTTLGSGDVVCVQLAWGGVVALIHA